MLDYSIIEASEQWTDKYRSFCQNVYQTTYPRPERGITAELFSIEFFDNPRVRRMFEDLCRSTATSKFWLALDKQGAIMGGVVAQKKTDYCDMKAFYVAPKLQGHGIGHALFQKVLQFAGSLYIQVDVVEYMQDTIDTYKHWGFEVDTSKGKLRYPITEWPTEAVDAYQAVYMIRH